ncbi:MAG: hypothetical protein K2R98_02575 [Gemmataceae bacterium]|nr:hypothetical protein [Gemmataceae bacterium]
MEVATGKVLREFADKHWIPDALLSPNRKLRARFASERFDLLLLDRETDDETAIRLELVGTDRVHRFLQGHRGRIDGIAFSPDGKSVASGGQDGVIRLWEIATGKERLRLTGHQGRVHTIAFAPDGRSLVSGSADSTVLVWDISGATAAERSKKVPDAERIRVLLNDLASPDAGRAYQAANALVDFSQQTMPVLKSELQPVRAADAKRIAQWLADLDSRQFAVRQQATEELEKLGELAAEALHQTLAQQPPLEVRQRVQRLLELLDAPDVLPDRLRGLRTVELLERIGTPEARALLERLGNGTPESRVTQEARSALKRLR